MTKVAVIADAHVANHRRWGGPVTGGLNARGWECVGTLRRASAAAAHAGCSALAVLGDLFDASRPSPPLVYETLRALTSGGIPVVVVLGNHDRQSQHDVDHACAVAALVPGVRVVAQPTAVDVADVRLLCVPYQAGRADEWFPAGVAALCRDRPVKRPRFVMTHLGVWDDRTPAFLKGAHDAVSLGLVHQVARDCAVDGVFAGNWHAARCWVGDGWQVPVVIPGTVCPHNFSDPPGHGRMGVVGGQDALYREVVVLSPSFVTVDLAGLVRAVSSLGEVPDQADPADHPRLYLRVEVDAAEVADAVALRAEVEARRLPVVVHVEVAGDDARAQAREAARRVATADDASLAEEFAAAVEAPGTRQGVLDRLAAYRKAAS